MEYHGKIMGYELCTRSLLDWLHWKLIPFIRYKKRKGCILRSHLPDGSHPIIAAGRHKYEARLRMIEKIEVRNKRLK